MFFRVFGALGQFGETRTQFPDFSRILNFHYFNISVYKFAFQDGVNELFWPSGSGDIAKQLLKDQF